MANDDRREAKKPLGAPTARAPATSLPAESDGRSLKDQRDELLVQIDEVESTLRFMGQSHPKRVETESMLKQLRTMLQALDASLR
jgi:hypothetical protein